jgi:hypothetical protein
MRPDLRITEDVERGEGFDITVDGERIRAFPGETVAGALLAAGKYALRVTRRGSPRGVFCGIGYCYDCRMTIDGRPNERACLTPARPGCEVLTQLATNAPASPER